MENKYLIKLTEKIEGTPFDYDPSLNGLGGWMVLVIIGQFSALISVLYSLIIGISFFREYIFSLSFLLYLFIYMIPISLVFNTLILIQTFKRSILFRKLYIIHIIIIFSLLAALTIYATISGAAINYTNYIISFIGVIIWVLYLYQSKRVRNTFIYPYMDFEQDDEGQAICVQEIEL